MRFADRSLFGLRGQILALAMGVILLTVGPIAAFGLTSALIDQWRSLENHGWRLATVMTQNTQYALYTRDPASFEPVLRGIDADETIDYAALLDPLGNPIASRRKEDAPRSFPLSIGPAERFPTIGWLEIGGRYWVDVRVPIFSTDETDPLARPDDDEVVGTVRLLVTDRTVRANTMKMLGFTALATFLVVVAGSGLALLVTQRIVEPLNVLADATSRTGEDHLDPVGVPEDAGEITVLARSYNQMLDRLRSSRAEVQAHHDTLEARVALRTEELQQAMEQARILADEAQAAARAKSRFLANMSHEIRTPMNSVLGLSDVLKRRPLAPDEHELATTIHRAAEGLLALLNDVLDLSKAEAGQLHLERSPLYVPSLIESAIGLVAHDTRSRGLELRTVVDPSIRWVEGDETRLRQILLNLLTNAVKFTSAGSVTLSVSAEGSGLLRFEVEDTGIGIDLADQDRLFSPFVQADESTSRRFGGTGLGLAICRQLIERMEGRIGLRSTLGSGTTVWFAVPLPAVDAPSSRILPAETAWDGSPRRRILVVEDNTFNQLVARKMLEELGHEVDVVGSGQEASRTIEAFRYDLVLMDCQMPGWDGPHTTAVIRARETEIGRAPVPIVALTAHAMPEDRERALASGMDGYVTKPFTQAMLAHAITEFARVVVEPKPVAAPVPWDPVLMALFESDARSLVARAAQASEAGDLPTLIFVAHTLKGTAAQFGAPLLSQLAQELEREAKAGRVATSVVAELEPALLQGLGTAEAQGSPTPTYMRA